MVAIVAIAPVKPSVAVAVPPAIYSSIAVPVPPPIYPAVAVSIPPAVNTCVAIFAIATVDPAITVAVHPAVNHPIPIAVIAPVDLSVAVAVEAAIYPAVAVAVAAADVATPLCPVVGAPFLPDYAVAQFGTSFLPRGAIDIPVLPRLALRNSSIAAVGAIGIEIAIYSLHPAVLPRFSPVAAGFETGLAAIVPVLRTLRLALTGSAIGSTFSATIPLQIHIAGQICRNRASGEAGSESDFSGGCGGGHQHRGRHQAGD